jgi:flagellar hook-basal body complex protein FliE
MSINGIEFGGKMQMGGMSNAATDRLREQREIAMDNAADAKEAEGSSKSFGDFMKDLATDANTSSLQADAKMNDVAAGRNKDLHGAVLAMEKADVNFRLLTQVRNKVIDAYREILRMQV